MYNNHIYGQYLEIRDKIINPNDKNNEYIERFLIENINKFIGDGVIYIEEFYGYALSVSNVNVISLLNLFVREHNIKINKHNVMRQIYFSDCQKISEQERFKDCIITHSDYDDRIKYKYILEFRNRFQ
jgi:hypothetical protein